MHPAVAVQPAAAMKMPHRKLPILHNLVSNNLPRIYIYLSRMKKPMFPNLIFLNKSRELKHYNYGFLGEYQFDSPSSIPLIHYPGRSKQLKSRSIQHLYSMLSWCRCFGCLKPEARGERADCSPLPAHIGGELVSELLLELEDDHEDSVDVRAEKFIESFYAEMRLQRQGSF